MRAIRTPALTLAALLLLQACASNLPPSDPADTAVAQDPNDMPELTLNLPSEDSCICQPETTADYTFLEKGISALAAGDHIEAVQHFQRYQRLESSPSADWEAGIAIAYDSMLPGSPFYAPQAAAESYDLLRAQKIEKTEIHPNILLMSDALETFVSMNRQMEKLKSGNAILKEDLEKREEALKRLRELTLGQKGSRE